MHDEREWWRPYVAAVEVARANGDDRAHSSYYSADQAKEGEWIAPRGLMPVAPRGRAATLSKNLNAREENSFCSQTNGPKLTGSAGGVPMVRSMHLRCAAVALFTMAVAYAVSAWTISSARAFTMENLSTGGNTTRFAEPDGPANNSGRGAQLFGPGGPMVQFGARQGQLAPIGRSPGAGYNSTPPEPYARPLGNGD